MAFAMTVPTLVILNTEGGRHPQPTEALAGPARPPSPDQRGDPDCSPRRKAFAIAMRDQLPAMALPPKSADDCIPSWASADCSQVPDGLKGTVWRSLASFGRRSSKRQAEGRVARANDRKGRHACDDTRGDPPVVRGRIQRGDIDGLVAL